MSSCRIPRHVLQRVSDRKIRKLAIDESDPISSDTDVVLDSQLEIIETSQSSLKGYRDLFGEFISYTPVSNTNNVAPKSKSVKKTLESKKKNQPCEIIKKSNPKKNPPRIFPTPKIIKIMQNVETELYSIMGNNSYSSSDISKDKSVESNIDLNVSGIHHLIDSPASSSDEENKENCAVFKGVCAFIDYKINGECCGKGIRQELIKLGAQVEKTFNHKVTHVVFREGNPKTYDKATERNIPLVSARWVHNSRIANLLLNPINYPPIDIEKFQEPLKLTYDITNKPQKTVEPSKNQTFKKKCDDFMVHINNFPIHLDENNENSTSSKTSKKQNPLIERIDSHKTNDNIITILSDQLCRVLNTNDSPMPNKNIDELYLPMSIKQLRKILTPSEKENKTPTKFDSDLAQIEDCLNLNSQARRRLRKLLFPTKEIPIISIDSDSDFPSPSPQKLRISAPAKLTSSKKQKNKLNTESRNKNLNNNEKTPPVKRIDKNGLGWRIPTELRPKKKKHIIPKQKSMQSEKTQSSIFSRNSSTIFETPQNSLVSPEVSQKISCTGMKKSEIANIKLAIQNLGKFTFNAKVDPLTTYLVTKSPADRTLNMVFAMAFGCCIVSDKWINESYTIGRWLPHQPYLIKNLSEPVKKFQTRRQIFGSSLTFHIFDDAGSIYISDTCDPSARQLKQLVRACGGKCISDETRANVVVGYTPRRFGNIREKWILDCITQGVLLNKNEYTLVNNNI